MKALRRWWSIRSLRRFLMREWDWTYEAADAFARRKYW